MQQVQRRRECLWVSLAVPAPPHPTLTGGVSASPGSCSVYPLPPPGTSPRCPACAPGGPSDLQGGTGHTVPPTAPLTRPPLKPALTHAHAVRRLSYTHQCAGAELCLTEAHRQVSREQPVCVAVATGSAPDLQNLWPGSRPDPASQGPTPHADAPTARRGRNRAE